jgi:CubicO group peptidase (beta-lactamase class C family)
MQRLPLAFLVLGLAAAALRGEPGLSRAKPSEVGMSEQRLAHVGSALRAEIEAGRIPGAVVAIARQGRLIYLESFGFLDAAKKTPMAIDAIFPIASMTKPLTATGALMLVSEGRMFLNDSVSMYLPAIGKMQVATANGTEPVKRPISLQDLMRHTAGLTYGLGTGTELEKKYAGLTPAERTPAEFIERLSQLPLHYQPGAQWDYGLGHEVMGVIIETLTKQRLADYLSARLFKPLGMIDTAFFVDPAKAARVARPLEKDPVTGERIPNSVRIDAPPLDNGGGGAYSTAMDYLRFAELLRRGGVFDGKRYLGRKAVEFMTSDQMTSDINLERLWVRENIKGYGFGSSVAVRRGNGLAGVMGTTGDFHWGGASGTYFWVDPKEELSVVFMARAPGVTRLRMRQLITTTVLQAIE